MVRLAVEEQKKLRDQVRKHQSIRLAVCSVACHEAKSMLMLVSNSLVCTVRLHCGREKGQGEWDARP
jgi:hypothetical protein